MATGPAEDAIVQPGSVKWAFGLIATVATALSLTAGLLVTISFFIADRAPQGSWSLAVHLVISGVFLMLGILLAGIAMQVLGLAKIAGSAGATRMRVLSKGITRLMILLSIVGLGLSAILAILTYGILARIDEGFAVFG